MNGPNAHIKEYILIALFSVIFTLSIVFLYTKFQPNNQSLVSIPESTISPTQTISQNPTSVESPAPHRLIAYIENSNVFIFDPSTKQSRQITKNGSITSIRWSKDGRWLYWLARYKDKTNYGLYSFGRGEYPNFNVDIFLDADKEIFNNFSGNGDLQNDIYTFFPLVTRNQLIIGSRDGLYLATLIGDRKADYKQLFKYHPLEGTGDSNIKDSYGLTDVDTNEKYMLLSYCTWEMCPDSGYSEIDNPRFISFSITPDDKNTTFGDGNFSPSSKYVLVGGGQNDMTGYNPSEIVYSFPKFEKVLDLKSIYNKDIESSIFLGDDTVAIVQEDISHIPGESVNVKIAIVDVNKQEELSHTNITLRNKSGGEYLYLISGDSKEILYAITENGSTRYYSVKINPDFSFGSTDELYSTNINKNWYFVQTNL